MIDAGFWRGRRMLVDELGGFDPYSSSKGCQELAAASYRDSLSLVGGNVGIATARAGNVTGGGDWAEHRLVPDVMQAAVEGRAVTVRDPDSVRPWQHVLNPLSGYRDRRDLRAVTIDQIEAFGR